MMRFVFQHLLFLGVFALYQTYADATTATTTDATDITTTTTTNNIRNLQNFDGFNELFDNAKIIIRDDFEVSQRVGIATLDLRIRHIECYDLEVGNINMQHNRRSNQEMDVSVNVRQLDLMCDIDYNYDYGFLHGTGWVRVTTNDNSLTTQLDFRSSNWDTSPPDNSSVESCTTVIEINNMEFFGDFVSNIVEIFERLIRDIIEEQIEDLACSELGSLGTTFVSDALNIAGDLLGEYTGNLGEAVNDPLYLERTTTLPPTVNPLDLEDTTTLIGGWFQQALVQLDNMLGGTVPDPTNPGTTDLGINVLMRQNLLDSNQALVVDISQIPGFNPVIFQGHDKMMETTIRLNSVQLLGLDSLSNFKSIEAIGHQTLQVEMTWDRLEIDFDVTVDIKPSSLEDAIIQDSTSDGISENVRLKFSVSNMDVLASLYLVIDETALANLQLGSLLHTEHLVSCLLSVLHQAEMSGLHVDPQSVNPPTITGLVSSGIDQIFTDAIDAAFAMYEGVLSSTIPNIFQTSVRGFVNRDVLGSYLADNTDGGCPIIPSIPGYIDFRDLFLPPSEAGLSGGSGTEPYGDLAYLALQLVDGNLLSADNDGVLDLNEMLPSSIDVPGDLISLVKTEFANDYVRSFVERFEIGLQNARISNLDTMKLPTHILEPSSDDPHILSNILTMGPITDRPLNVSVGFHLLLEGPNTEGEGPIDMDHQIDVSISFPVAFVEVDFLAKIVADSLLQFPLQDIMIPECWLATIPHIPGSETLALDHFDLDLSSVNFNPNFWLLGSENLNANIISTNYPQGLSILNDLLDLAQSTGASTTFLHRIEVFAKEVVTGEWAETTLDQALQTAPKFCPSSPEYDPDFVRGNNPGEFTFPPLSALTIDTLFYGAGLVAEVGFVVFVERHRGIAPSNPLSRQQEAENEIDGTAVMDWTNMDETRLGSLMEMIINALAGYMGSPLDSNNSTLGVNSLIRDYLFEGNEDLRFEFDGVSFSLPGVRIGIPAITVKGLDSFTKFEIFETIAPQTINNTMHMEELAIEVEMIVLNSTREVQQSFTVSFSMQDIDISMAIFLALDQNLVEALEMGSLMNTTNILPCLLSAVHSMDITQLIVTPKVFDDPQIEGLLDETTESLVTFSNALLSIYRDQIIDTMPKIFDSTMKQLVNGLALAFIEDAECPTPQSDFEETFVDFRRFFDDNDDTYGNLPGILRNLLDSELLSEDPDTGRPLINEALIVPYTRGQSGIVGEISFPRDVFSFQVEDIPQFGVDDLTIHASTPRIRNLDTIGNPIELLNPNATNGQLLHNMITVGTSENPFQFSMTGLMALTGDPALEMHNEIEIAVNLVETELIAALLAKVNAESLFQFQIGEIGNADCWLAALVGTLLDEEGLISPDGETGLSLESIILSMQSMRFNVGCLNCTSPGLDILPEVFALLDAEGIADVLESRVVDLGLDLVTSEFFEEYVNSLLVDGSLRCPHSPTFVNEDASADYPVPSLPTLTYDSLETIAFAATVFTHIATAVIAESHALYDTNTTDPLSGQEQLDLELDSDIRLVNFTSLDTSLGEWVDVAFEQAIAYLSTPVGNDLRVNDLLRSTLLENDGSITMNFDDVSVGGDELEVSLKKMRITGLDSISSINVLDAIGPQTLRNELRWDRLGLEVVISLMASEEEPGSGRFLQSREDITVKLDLVDIDVSLAMLLAMDLDMMGSLELGQVLNIKNILPCLLSAARAASLTELEVLVGSIQDFSVQGFRSDLLNSAAADSSRMLLDNYGPLILSSMPGFFDSTVRALLNNWIGYKMFDWTNSTCPKSTVEATGLGFLDFRDLLLSPVKSLTLGGIGSSPYGDLFSTAYQLVQDVLFKVDPDTGMSAANGALVGPITRSQSNLTGTIIFPGDVISGGTRLKVGGLDANVQLKASDFRIDHVDTMGEPLAVLEAVAGEAHHLNNTATFGGRDDPLRIGARLFFLLEDAEMEIRNEVDFSLDLQTANILVTALLKIAETRFRGFPLRDALNYNCWMALVPAPSLDARGVRVEGEDPTVSVEELAASIARVNMKMTCVDCTSPRMAELADLLSSTEAQDAATELSNQLLDYVAALMGGNYLQTQIDRLLNDAARKCPHRPEYDAEGKEVAYEPFEVPESDYATTYLMLLAGVALGLVVVVSIVGFFVRCFVRRRHRKWLSTLPRQQVRRLAIQQEKEQAWESEMSNSTTSMFTSPDIPAFVRWSMPVVLLGNIALFLSGHLSLGATVNIEATIAGETFKAGNFFEFSMAKSTVDIWNAGGRELAILILIFSGIWPYTKTLMTLGLWFTSPTKVSVSKRGSVLLWLDWLAKWSMIDIFVLVISIVAFRISVQSPDTGILPPDFYSVDLLVVPLWGLYANMTAQLVSQVSSHFIIHYHRRIVDVATTQHKEESSLPDGNQDDDSQADSKATTLEKNRLNQQEFVRPHRGETEKLVTYRWVNKALCIIVACLTLLVVLGCALPSFSLDILGLVGVAVESGQGFEQAETFYSVFTVIELLLSQAAFLGTAGDYVGLGSLSIILALTVLVVPIAQAFVLLWQWFALSTTKAKARISILAETLQAWQYAEVYLIAIFVASWQLGPMSEFMINSYCNSLKDTFAQLVYYGLLQEDDAQCFAVRSSIEPGSLILAAGAILLALINTFVTKASFQYFRDLGNQNDGDNLDDHMLEDIEADSVERNIHPVPVLFTDTFRWLLHRAGSIQTEPHDVLSDLVKDDAAASSSTLQNMSTAMDESLITEEELEAQSSKIGEESTHKSRSYTTRATSDDSMDDSEG